MGNKTSKKKEQKKLIQLSEIQHLTNLYNNIKWEEFINAIEPLFTKRDKNLNNRSREERINLRKFLREILNSLPEDHFHNLVNKNMNCYFLINTFKNDKIKLEYILKSNPQKYLFVAITELSDYYIKFLLDFGAKPTPKIIDKAIEHRSNEIFNLLIDELVKNNEKENKLRVGINEYYNICLNRAVLSKKKDIILSIIGRMKFETINFDDLYKNYCFDDGIKQFLDKILEAKISKVV